MPDLGDLGTGVLAEWLEPGAVAAEGMVDREQSVAERPVARGFAEVDPADVAEDVGMAAVGGDLLARQEGDAALAADWGKERVVADRVVVGDGQEVETATGGEFGQFGDGVRAVAVHGVGVEVARQPAQAVDGGDVPARWTLPDRRSEGFQPHLRRDRAAAEGPLGDQVQPRPGGGGGGDLQGVVEALGRDPVQAEPDLPGAGFGLTGQVAGGRAVHGDRVLLAGAARPAAEAVRGGAAQVENALGAVVAEPYRDGGRSWRDLERHLARAPLQPVGQRPAAVDTIHGGLRADMIFSRRRGRRPGASL